MSRIYFDTPTDSAELWGAERAWMGRMCTDLTAGVIDGLDRRGAEAIIPDDCYLHGLQHTDMQWLSSFKTWFVTDYGKSIRFNGEMLPLLWIHLNTTIAVGRKPLQLMARIHGTCEVHGWIPGEHRAWVASIIRRGRARYMMRDLPGNVSTWEDVIDLLERDETEPVVMSYSVCDLWPDQENPWTELPSDDLAITPDSLGLGFSNGGWPVTAFDLLAESWRSRAARKDWPSVRATAEAYREELMATGEFAPPEGER